MNSLALVFKMLKWLLLFSVLSNVWCAKRHFRIGGLFNSHENVRLFSNTVDEINTELFHQQVNITLDGSASLSNTNDLLTYIDFCKNIVSKQIHGLLVIAEETELDNFKLILQQATSLGIPTFVVGIRNNLLSDKRTYPTVMRTVSPWSYQVDGWVALMRHFGFRAFHLLHTLDTDGWAFRTRVEKHIRTYEDDIEKDVKVASVLGFKASAESYKSELIRLLGSEYRVFCLHALVKDLCLILKEIEELKLTGLGYVWFVSEVALGCATIPPGTIILRQRLVSDIGGHTKDSLNFMVKVLSTMPANLEEPLRECIFGADPWFPGYQFFHNALKIRSSSTVTGYLSLDYYGQREFSNYDILNVDVDQKKNIVGSYLYSKVTKSMVLSVNDSAIRWGGGTSVKPSGVNYSKHLKVVTVPELPFVYARQLDDDFQCTKDEVPCPLYRGGKTAIHKFCCEGYSIDLLRLLSERINFTFSLSIPDDGMFGSYDYHGNRGIKTWSGVVGKLVRKDADLAIGALTSTEERANFIDLSVSFRHQGIAVLERKVAKTSTLVSFLQPFRGSLWITVMVAVHVVALTLYLLDRFSPFGRYKLPNSDHPEEDALNLSSAIWFAWGVLLNSGIGEGTPRSFSARVLGMVWAGFAMIIVASYTANLAAFLVLDRPKTTLHGLYDPRLRNPADNFTFSTVKGSAVEYYLKNQLELSRVYKTMIQYAVDTAEEGVHAVKDGRISAFVWDSTRLEYESARDCDLVVSSEQFGRSGYVLGLRKGSKWTQPVNQAILDLLEQGTLAELDRKWILGAQLFHECEKPSSEPATLGLRNMAGVFILVACGIIGGVALIGIEILFKRYYSRKQRRIELARHAFDRWKNMVKRRKMLRTTIEHQRRSKLNGTVSSNFASDFNNADSIFVIGEGRYFDV